MQYSFIVPNTKVASYRLITITLLLVNILMFGILYLGNAVPYQSLCFLGFFAHAMALAALFFSKRFPQLLLVRTEIVFIIGAILWFILGKYFIAVLLLAFACAGLFTNRPLIIIINENGILYPSFPVKKIAWPDVEQVLLKDDVLTIDLKNNKLLQFTLQPEIAAGIDVQGFNEFCRRWQINY